MNRVIAELCFAELRRRGPLAGGSSGARIHVHGGLPARLSQPRRGPGQIVNLNRMKSLSLSPKGGAENITHTHSHTCTAL
jgi:hypothetical protein